jgi:hypothetical protein
VVFSIKILRYQKILTVIVRATATLEIFSQKSLK